MNINSVAIRNVSATTQMGKYLFLKTERGQKMWGETERSIKNGSIMKNGRFHFPHGSTEMGPKNGSLPSETVDLTVLA